MVSDTSSFKVANLNTWRLPGYLQEIYKALLQGSHMKPTMILDSVIPLAIFLTNIFVGGGIGGVGYP